MLAILVISYCSNRKDRVSSFYWTRGSKLCFLTCFSYFSCYFLILVFLRNCYLLILFCAFLGCTEIRFLVPFLIPLALWASTLYMHPHSSGKEYVGFLTWEGQNFDLAKYIVSSTRYEYSIQYCIIQHNTLFLTITLFFHLKQSILLFQKSSLYQTNYDCSKRSNCLFLLEQ